MAAAAGDALPFPIYGAKFRVVFPVLDTKGQLVPGAAALDSERSIDQNTFADCTNEATEIATSSGMYFLDLTNVEMQASCLAIITKTSTTNANTSPIILYPRRYPIFRTGTAQAGAAGTITLDASASDLDDFYNGMIIQCLNDVPSGVIGQTRFITNYVGSTNVATVGAVWGTNPSSSTTFEIFVPEGARGIENVPEIGQKTPGATASLEEIAMYQYMMLRNDNETTTTERRIKNDAGTVIAKSTMADNGTTFNQGELVSGP